jgi:hypothetical protein
MASIVVEVVGAAGLASHPEVPPFDARQHLDGPGD